MIGEAMKAGELASLFQLSVAINLGFGALLSFVDPIRQETNSSSIVVDRYIVDRTAKQAGRSPRYLGALNELCRTHYQYQTLMAKLKSNLRYYDGLAVRILFAVLAAVSLIGLVWVSAVAKQPIPGGLIVIPVLFNAGPILFAFWLCYQLSTYYREIRPLSEQSFKTIRQLETMT